LLGFGALYLGRTGAVSSSGALKVLPHPFRFVFFERAGVRLLFGHANGRQGVKDCPALYFQFAC
jgi:hypothetical protein